MRIIVAGGRDFSDYEFMVGVLDRLFSRLSEVVIISGMARGADNLGHRYAREHGIEVIEMPANWKAHGRAAGMIRNSAMLEVAEGLVAFWDGKSPGTRDMISKAKAKGIHVRVISY